MATWNLKEAALLVHIQLYQTHYNTIKVDKHIITRKPAKVHTYPGRHSIHTLFNLTLYLAALFQIKSFA